jgi:hypothetical protein
MLIINTGYFLKKETQVYLSYSQCRLKYGKCMVMTTIIISKKNSRVKDTF